MKPLEILLILFLICLFIVSVLFIYTVWRKRIKQWSTDLMLRQLKSVHLVIEDSIQAQRVGVLKEVNQKQWLYHLMEDLKLKKEHATVEEASVIDAIATYYFQELFRQELQSPKKMMRYRALLYSNYFCIAALSEEVREIKAAYPEEEMERITYLIQFDPTFSIETLHHLQFPHSSYEWLTLFGHMTVTQFEEIARQFKDFPMDVQLSILDYLALYQPLHCESCIHQALLQQEEELIVRAMKAAIALKEPVETATLDALLRREEWEVRMFTIRYIGLMEQQDAIETIRQALTDRNFLIRREAGRALAKTAKGQQQLKQVIQQSTDPYAVEMAMESLREEGQHE